MNRSAISAVPNTPAASDRLRSLSAMAAATLRRAAVPTAVMTGAEAVSAVLTSGRVTAEFVTVLFSAAPPEDTVSAFLGMVRSVGTTDVRSAARRSARETVAAARGTLGALHRQSADPTRAAAQSAALSADGFSPLTPEARQSLRRTMAEAMRPDAYVPGSGLESAGRSLSAVIAGDRTMTDTFGSALSAALTAEAAVTVGKGRAALSAAISAYSALSDSAAYTATLSLARTAVLAREAAEDMPEGSSASALRAASAAVTAAENAVTLSAMVDRMGRRTFPALVTAAVTVDGNGMPKLDTQAILTVLGLDSRSSSASAIGLRAAVRAAGEFALDAANGPALRPVAVRAASASAHKRAAVSASARMRAAAPAAAPAAREGVYSASARMTAADDRTAEMAAREAARSYLRTFAAYGAAGRQMFVIFGLAG